MDTNTWKQHFFVRSKRRCSGDINELSGMSVQLWLSGQPSKSNADNIHKNQENSKKRYKMAVTEPSGQPIDDLVQRVTLYYPRSSLEMIFWYIVFYVPYFMYLCQTKMEPEITLICLIMPPIVLRVCCSRNVHMDVFFNYREVSHALFSLAFSLLSVWLFFTGQLHFPLYRQTHRGRVVGPKSMSCQILGHPSWFPYISTGRWTARYLGSDSQETNTLGMTMIASLMPINFR